MEMTTSEFTKRYLIFDGNAILHRAYHAYPLTLKTKSGELTNAVYGFAAALLRAFVNFRPQYAAVCFDVKGPTFRHEKFIGYKSSRPKMDEELVSQINRVHEFVDVLNLPNLGMQGFEADDLIGTLAKNVVKLDKNLEVIIITGDRDILQLLNNQVKVYFPARGQRTPEQFYDVPEFIEKWGFKPQQLIDFKALAGDSSDDIPGVKGVGPKTATELIQKYHSLENIYQNLDDISDKIQEKLIRDKDLAFMSYDLATIKTDVELDFDPRQAELKDYDREKAEEFFDELQFRSLKKRLPTSDWQIPNPKIFQKSEPKVKEALATDQLGLF